MSSRREFLPLVTSLPLFLILVASPYLLANAVISSASITVDNDQTDKRMIIIFEDNVTRNEQEQIIKNSGVTIETDLRPLFNGFSVSSINTERLQSLAEEDKIESVFEDLLVQALHHNPSAGGSEYSNFGAWSVDHIHSSAPHKSGIKGDGVKVAVLDTGIDYTHPDLSANYAGGYNFVSQTADPFDDNGHGTFVSAIIAADDDGRGMVGVAPDSKIYALKVLDENGAGYISDVAVALQWCIDNKIDIVSMSFGLQSDSQILKRTVENAYNNGILMVAAGGNIDSIIAYPAAYSQVIAVGATDRDNNRAEFSATGSDLEVVAPGQDVVSARPVFPGGPFTSMNGTSASASHVAGVAALLKSSDEKLWFPVSDGDGLWSVQEITKALHQTTEDLGDKGWDQQFGYGLIDAGKVVRSNDVEPKIRIESLPKPENSGPSVPAFLV